jgi:hypothetical protein
VAGAVRRYAKPNLRQPVAHVLCRLRGRLERSDPPPALRPLTAENAESSGPYAAMLSRSPAPRLSRRRPAPASGQSARRLPLRFQQSRYHASRVRPTHRGAPQPVPGLRRFAAAPLSAKRGHIRPAALRMRSLISCGCEIRDRWLDFTSIVVAPILLAMKRWRSGLMVRSSVETA